jgi:hypothetical protein
MLVLVGCVLVMGPKCGSGDDETEDAKADYTMAYCAQDGLTAFPFGGTDWVKGKFADADKKVGLKAGPQNLTLEGVRYPDRIFNYWSENCVRDGNDNPVCPCQLFAIMSFVDAQNVPIDTLGGLFWSTAFDYGSPSAFVAVVTLESRFSQLPEDTCRRGISSNTIHELGHLLCGLVDCRDNPGAHPGRDCVMADHVVIHDGSAVHLMNVCQTDVLPFRDDFCVWCRDNIKNAKIVPEL